MEKNGVSGSWISARNSLSPSHWGSAASASLCSHSSTPSLHSRSVPVQPVAVNRCIYSPSQISDTKVMTPRYR